MYRLLLGLAALAVVGGAVAFSRQAPTADRPAGALTIAAEAKNPWTHLDLNNPAEQFQFVVVSDRTGGHRANIFSKAVHQINLLQPEFVVSVGDLIEGYSEKPDVLKKEWDEFDAYTKKFEMPFFYVPGNHDLANPAQIEYWGGRYGRTHYHFVYKNVLFLAINSEDGKASQVTAEQQAAIRKVLDENKNVRWTMVFLHKPLWRATDLEQTGWDAVEAALAGRKYTVFCGHVHRYQKFVRNGMNYYQLATTGGGSKLRGLEYGEFDHVTLITMKKDGPLLANVMLDGILPENLDLPETAEPGSLSYQNVQKLVLHPVRGVVTLDGKPADGVTVTLRDKHPKTGKERAVADALTAADGSFVLSTVRANDGAPAGEYKVTVAKTGKGYYDGETEEKSLLPAKYAKSETSGLTVVVKAGTNEINIDLRSK